MVEFLGRNGHHWRSSIASGWFSHHECPAEVPSISEAVTLSALMNKLVPSDYLSSDVLEVKSL